MLKKVKRQFQAKTKNAPTAFDGQVILEFTFCMIIILLMIYGVVKVFHWTGRDLVERRIAHDAVLRGDILPQACAGRADLCLAQACSNCHVNSIEIYRVNVPRRQIDPYFYRPVDMNAIWVGK